VSEPRPPEEAVAGFLRRRREAVARHPSQIGIDYVVVARDVADPTRLRLELHFVPADPANPVDTDAKHQVLDGLTADNVRFFKDDVAEDGLFELDRVGGTETLDSTRLEEVLTLRVRLAGETDRDRRRAGEPILTLELAGLSEVDPFFSRTSFSVALEPPLEEDCAAECPPPPEEAPEAIDYLARDYGSFRQVLIERLGQRLPRWTERSAADQMVALTEVLADAADQLAYFQDAVATEAYLGTARRRVSVRRHARLVGHRMGEGTNARAWVRLETAGDAVGIQPGSGTIETAGTAVLGTGTRFTTELRVGDAIRADGETRLAVAIPSDTELELDEPFSAGLAPGTGFLRPGAQLLPRVPGLSAAVLPTSSPELRQYLAGGPVTFETVHPIELYQAHNEMPIYTWGSPEYALPQGATRTSLEGSLPDLRRGDVVVFEEVRGRDTGLAEDADPQRRHAVRLTRATAAEDPLGRGFPDPPVAEALTEIEWDAADALPFTLAVSKVLADGTVTAGIAVARGNVVLADHGRTVGGAAEAVTATEGRFRPRLVHPGLTHRVPYYHRAALYRPAAEAFAQDPRDALPVIAVRDAERVWNPRPDLLLSDRFAPDFVVEMQDDGHGVLRFGDGSLGRPPKPGTVLTPRYRVGRGAAGNLGAESLAHLVSDAAPPVTAVTNPIAARGGTDPETLAETRRAAPGRLLDLEACTREQEFAKVASRHPEVKRAAARLRWTGSWHRLVVAVERHGHAGVDEAFQAELRAFLEDYRLGGWELVVEPLSFVGLDILLTVHVAPGAIPAAVERRLLEAFSNRTLADGSRGFFHPDNFTFGESVYLSQVIATAMAVDGVVAVDTDDAPPRLNRFRRFGEPARGELAIGQIRLTGTEIARVDNDPNAPENGRIRFFMEGGR
jgi:hypothetical protein